MPPVLYYGKKKNRAYRIPKLSLIEYLDSPQHKRNSMRKQDNLMKRKKS